MTDEASSSRNDEGPAGPYSAPQPEPLGYVYEDANTDYAYGPPVRDPYGRDVPYAPGPYSPGPYAQAPPGQTPYGPGPYAQAPYPQAPYLGAPPQSPLQQGAYGVPFYGQPTGPYALTPLGPTPLIEDPTAADAPRRGVGPVEAYKLFWKRAFTFTGRASLSEYWWVVGIHAAGVMGIAMVDTLRTNDVVALALALYVMAAVLPSIALGARRLHDTDNSGWLQILNFIPYLGSLVMMILMAQRPKESGRRYDAINQPRRF